MGGHFGNITSNAHNRRYKDSLFEEVALHVSRTLRKICYFEGSPIGCPNDNLAKQPRRLKLVGKCLVVRRKVSCSGRRRGRIWSRSWGDFSRKISMYFMASVSLYFRYKAIFPAAVLPYFQPSPHRQPLNRSVYYDAVPFLCRFLGRKGSVAMEMFRPSITPVEHSGRVDLYTPLFGKFAFVHCFEG